MSWLSDFLVLIILKLTLVGIIPLKLMLFILVFRLVFNIFLKVNFHNVQILILIISIIDIIWYILDFFIKLLIF